MLFHWGGQLGSATLGRVPAPDYDDDVGGVPPNIMTAGEGSHQVTTTLMMIHHDEALRFIMMSHDDSS